jgi:crotonobetainyl-CoA:carnitine CoA-transferase CaiB-like acyl-CoA transferase
VAGVLSGIRVVELASWTFVPAAGVVLADWGADVIKIEDVSHGDPGRGLVMGGLRRAEGRVDLNFMLELGNRGKRSIGIDLQSEAGLEYFYKLIASADVFLTNSLPRVRRKLKIDVDDIRAINPNIIYARGSGAGPRGPLNEMGGFDAASYMARGGIAYAMTPPALSRPIGQPPAFGDLPSGMSLAGGVAAALYKRATTGEASTVDVSLLAQAMWTIGPDIMAADFFDVDRIPGFMSDKALNPIAHKYRTRDNRWIQLVMLQPDLFWPNFVTRIGRPDLAADERFWPSSALIANVAEAVEILDEVFGAHDLSHWREVLADEKGVWAVVASPQELLDDPQAAANGYFAESADDKGNTYKLCSSPVQFDESPVVGNRAPEHGEHTESILLELGLTWAEIAEAKDSGAVL